MFQVETSVLIRCPVEEVLAFISDTRNSPQWQCGLAHIIREIEAPSLSRTRMRRSWSIAALPTESCEEKRRLGVISSRGPFELDSVYHLEPGGEDTKITWTCKVKAGEQYRFAEAMMSQVTVMETEISFMILKKLLEAEASSSTLPHVASTEERAVDLRFDAERSDL